MQIHPDIAALRSDPALQRQAQAPIALAMSEWRASESVAAVLNDVEIYDTGCPLGDCPNLSRLLHDHAVASWFVGKWHDALIDALAQQPLGQVPFRHSVAPGLATIQLISAGGAALSLLAYDKLPNPREPESVSFADREVSEIVLAGRARGYRHQITALRPDSAQIDTNAIIYEQGICASQQADRQTRQFVEVEGSMLLLQLTRMPKSPQPSREYLLKDGSLIHQVSGDKRASQHFVALDVLGALERKDAVPVMEELGLLASEDPDLRWESVRQTLALDTARGLALLGDLSAREGDPLCGPATSLRQSLIAAHAQLAQFAKETA